MTEVSVADTWTVSGANVDPNAPSESPMSTSTREGRSSVRAPDGIAESRNLGVVTRRVTESLRTSQAMTRTSAVPGTSPTTSVPGGTWYPSGTATAVTGSRATAESLDWKCSVMGAPVVVMARGVSTASCVAPITIVLKGVFPTWKTGAASIRKTVGVETPSAVATIVSSPAARGESKKVESIVASAGARDTSVTLT